MQETRRQILEILFDHGKVTVDEIASNLRKIRDDNITSVTVRHHLTKLQEDGLVSAPLTRHRSSPGRPRHIYKLTNHGASFFPNNYEQMTIQLVKKMNAQLSPSTTNVILEGIADDMAIEANIPEGSMKERLESVVLFLNSKGYNATWEENTTGYTLSTCSCPYHHVAQESESLCQLDMRLISKMLGTVPRLQSRISQGDDMCAFFIPYNDTQ